MQNSYRDAIKDVVLRFEGDDLNEMVAALKCVDSWILLPPGDRAICRRALPEVPKFEGYRMATSTELLCANLGRPFPWGEMPSQKNASLLWQERMIGYGGLYHDKWFVTTEGRFGGAENVPVEPPGSLRSCLLYDGGETQDKGNEGYAVVKMVDPVNRDIYRKVQIHAARHVVADGGHIILSPRCETTGVVYAGFMGRCQKCPNAEDISFPQLQAAVPQVKFEKFEELEGWSLIARPTPKADFPVLGQ